MGAPLLGEAPVIGIIRYSTHAYFIHLNRAFMHLKLLYFFQTPFLLKHKHDGFGRKMKKKRVFLGHHWEMGALKIWHLTQEKNESQCTVLWSRHSRKEPMGYATLLTSCYQGNTKCVQDVSFWPHCGVYWLSGHPRWNVHLWLLHIWLEANGMCSSGFLQTLIRKPWYIFFHCCYCYWNKI